MAGAVAVSQANRPCEERAEPEQRSGSKSWHGDVVGCHTDAAAWPCRGRYPASTRKFDSEKATWEGVRDSV